MFPDLDAIRVFEGEEIFEYKFRNEMNSKDNEEERI